MEGGCERLYGLGPFSFCTFLALSILTLDTALVAQNQSVHCLGQLFAPFVSSKRRCRGHARDTCRGHCLHSGTGGHIPFITDTIRQCSKTTLGGSDGSREGGTFTVFLRAGQQSAGSHDPSICCHPGDARKVEVPWQLGHTLSWYYFYLTY